MITPEVAKGLEIPKNHLAPIIVRFSDGDKFYARWNTLSHSWELHKISETQKNPSVEAAENGLDLGSLRSCGPSSSGHYLRD